jgi:hypothetical protein
MNGVNPSRGDTLLSMSPVSRGRKSKKQKRVQKSRQRPARVAVQHEDTQFADLLAVGSRPGQPYQLLPEWVRWNGEQIGVPGPLIERSVAVAERRQSDISDCPSFRFRPGPGGAP